MAARPDVRITRATEGDVPLLLHLIRSLAEYERLSHEVLATEARLQASLFGPSAVAEAAIARIDQDPVGFAVWFHNYSTFLGRPGIYLEDLFVLPASRRHGVGRRLLAYVARVAVERQAGRMEWSVLDWNEPALGLYRAVGARPMTDWTVQRLDGDALARLAAESDDSGPKPDGPT